MSRAKSRRSPITGSIVAADIVLVSSGREKEIRDEILRDCRDQLAAYKVPAFISFVETLDVTIAGKLSRT
jgi:acyl-coenzyme A synthetase/AMP-(fatty) acid ligase